MGGEKSPSVIALLDPGLEEEEGEELGSSDKNDMSSLERQECPQAENNAVPGPSSIGGNGRPDGELPALMNAEDQLQMGSGDERQQIPSDKQQLPPPPELQA